jgi:hypothetical protein
MKPGAIGMVFDRAITPELLEVGLRVATESGDTHDARRLLTVALRDFVSAQEAEGKTKKCLSHIWVHPPEPARAMIRWAVDHQDVDPDRTVLHLGAILATFPFAGLVAAISGRQLRLEGKVDPRAVRSEARAVLGDRSTIDIGARKVVTSLRYLGLLRGPNGGPLGLGNQPVVPAELQSWITHALLLTRQVEAIDTDEPSRALELATVKFEPASRTPYPLTELHTQSDHTVAVALGVNECRN